MTDYCPLILDSQKLSYIRNAGHSTDELDVLCHLIILDTIISNESESAIVREYASDTIRNLEALST